MRSIPGTIALAALLVMSSAAAPAAASTRPAPAGRILYLESDGTAKSVRPDGRGERDLGRRLPWFSSPDWSPDGRRIAYTTGASGIHTMDETGGDDRRLVDSSFAPAYPRWSPDGRWITVETWGDIWAVHRDGQASGWSNLTAAHDSNDLIPAWAPGGRRFATANYNAIRVYSADGSRGRDLVALPSAYRLDWSPDGRTIAIEAEGDLWLVTVASGAVRRVTTTPEIQEISPVWSPDGRWLAYGRGPGTHDPEFPGTTADPVIWLARADGSGARSTGIPGVPSSWRAQR